MWSIPLYKDVMNLADWRQDKKVNIPTSKQSVCHLLKENMLFIVIDWLRDWLICNQVNAACASQAYVVPGLLEGQDYLFRVRAENRLGFGPFTVTTDPARARDPICEKSTFHRFSTDSQHISGIALMLVFLLLRPAWPSHQAESQPGDEKHCHTELGTSQKQWWLSSEALHHRALELGHQWQGEGDMEAVQ